ncbi:hypothetical protein LTR16_005138, partial [Cryomyces antarcticus]
MSSGMKKIFSDKACPRKLPRARPKSPSNNAQQKACPRFRIADEARRSPYRRMENPPADIPHQTQAIQAGSTVYLSGQIPADAQGKLVEGSVGEKKESCCQNIRAVLEAAGTDISRVVK